MRVLPVFEAPPIETRCRATPVFHLVMPQKADARNQCHWRTAPRGKWPRQVIGASPLGASTMNDSSWSPPCPRHMASQLRKRSAELDPAGPSPRTALESRMSSGSHLEVVQVPTPVDYSVLGKRSPAANGVLPVLSPDGVQLEVQLANEGQLLVEEVILPGPGS